MAQRTGRRQLVMACFAAAVWAICSISAWGASPDESKLRLTLSQSRVVLVESDGRLVESLRPLTAGGDESTALSPGDVIEYALTVKNASSGALDNVVAALPIAPEALYLDERPRFDAARVMIQFSIDHGERFQAPPVRYWETDERGNKVQKVAEPSMYTNVRWVFLTPLAAQEATVIRYRVQIQ